MARFSGRRFATVLFIPAFFSIVLWASPALGAGDPAGLAGCYDVTGFDSEELSYTGTLCITVLGNQLYELIWTQMEEDEGRVVYKGRGVSMGDDLFAVWSEDGSEYECYLHLFDIDIVDGTLSGLRVNVNGATSSQTAAREGGRRSFDWSRPGQLAGSYVLEGSEGITGGRLEVMHLPVDDDDAYSFRWSGGTELEGVGVREDNAVVVVANPVGQMSGTCGSITYTKNKESGELLGTFYTPDSLKGTTPRRRGEETASPRE